MLLAIIRKILFPVFLVLVCYAESFALIYKRRSYLYRQYTCRRTDAVTVAREPGSSTRSASTNSCFAIWATAVTKSAALSVKNPVELLLRSMDFGTSDQWLSASARSLSRIRFVLTQLQIKIASEKVETRADGSWPSLDTTNRLLARLASRNSSRRSQSSSGIRESKVQRQSALTLVIVSPIAHEIFTTWIYLMAGEHTCA